MKQEVQDVNSVQREHTQIHTAKQIAMYAPKNQQQNLKAPSRSQTVFALLDFMDQIVFLVLISLVSTVLKARINFKYPLDISWCPEIRLKLYPVFHPLPVTSLQMEWKLPAMWVTQDLAVVTAGRMLTTNEMESAKSVLTITLSG